MDRISPNFIYAFILARSTLGLLHIIFLTFVPELLPLIYIKISFPSNILRTNGQNFTKFYISIHIDKIYLGLLHIIFHTFVPDLWPLIYAKNSFLFYILRANGQNFTKLYITTNTVKIYVGIVSCHLLQICNFLQICKRVMALD